MDEGDPRPSKQPTSKHCVTQSFFFFFVPIFTVDHLTRALMTPESGYHNDMVP